MRDGSAVGVATIAATTAIRDGDLASARATLHGVLVAALPVPATAGAPLDVDVAEAASLYAAVLAAAGCARDGLGYSTRGYETACHNAQPGSDQRLKAAATHAYLLRATGDSAAAVAVGRDLARQLIARFGATDRRTLAAHGDLALMLHAAGDCLTGRQILHRTGELVRSTYGPGDPLAVRMRDRLAELTRECGVTNAVRAESDDAVAVHTCRQPAAMASISIGDLFGDLFAGDDHEAVDRPPREADDMAGTRSLVTDVTDVTDRPVGGPAALLAALGVAIPSARPTESSPAAAAGVDVVVADADVVAADGVDAVVAADANHSDRPAPRDAVDTAVRPDLPIGEAKSDASTDGSVSAGPEVEGVRTLTTDVPPWADRPTAGFPTVPVSAGLHPTWVAASREPAVAPREIVRASTVGAAGSAFGPPVTHSRATFGRMRRRATNLADSDRPQQTPTTRSNAKTTEGA